MNRFAPLLLAAALLPAAFGCSTGTFIARSHQDWAGETPPAEAGLAHRVLLVGDTGWVSEDVLALLKVHVQAAGEQGTVVFLGDNLYPDGLPDSADAARPEAEQRLIRQLEVVEDFPGRIVFIPGNHDWKDSRPGGLKALARQEAFIEAYLDRGNTFLPDDGFPGPVEVELTDRLTLVVLDTEWWMTHEDKPFGDTGDYELDEAGDVLLQLHDIIQRKDDEDLLIVGHHPVFSNGPHAGHMPLREHLFPLTATGRPLYVPLPVIGSLYPLYRRYIGGPQDLADAPYARFRRGLVRTLTQRETRHFIYAAGHEHSLQYVEHVGNHYLVSGSGSKGDFVAGGNGAGFTSSREGFMLLNYYEDGSVWLDVRTPSDEQPEGRLLFRTRIEGPAADLVDPEVPTADAYPDYTDTRVLAANPSYRAGPLKRWLLGDSHRDVWATRVEVPVLDLGRTAGGLTPVKRGGGMQTLSLRLEGEDGHDYVLRSIDKDPSATVPENLQGTIATDIVQDQIAAIHPYGAFIVPKLARAAGVYHTNPRLVFVPDDPRLGVYRATFGNQLMMFEDRPNNDMSHQASYGRSGDVVSAHDLYRALDEDNDHRVDQRAFLRVRLFDVLLSDWDRHRDQWRWASFEPHELNPSLEGDAQTQGKIYRPIPRDRDWAFNRMDGLLLALYRQLDPRFQSFNRSYGFLRGFTINGGEQDRRFTNALTRQDWIEIADSLRAALTDTVIEDAVENWPDPIVALHGEEMAETLKARRDQLPAMAEKIYAIYADVIDVVGSEKHERFEVERLNDEETRVVVYKTTREGDVREELYRRTFKRAETREIRLYGRDGNDRFIVTGEVVRGLRVTAVGGAGEDEFVDTSRVRGSGRATRFYDTETGNTWETGPETRAVRSDDPAVNVYDSDSYRPNLMLPTTYFGGNKDDGIFLGGGVRFIRHAFRKQPFAAVHTLRANFAARTRAFNVDYDGVFTSAVGGWDAGVDAGYFSPNSIRNFFGLGNETQNTEAHASFYEARLTQLVVAPFLQRTAGADLALRLGPAFEYIRVREDNDRFIGQPQAGVSPGTFENQWFVGLELEALLGETDRLVHPRRGFRWTNQVDVHFGLGETSERFTTLSSAFAFYATPPGWTAVTLAGRAGTAHNIGTFPFFRASTLGSKDNLRGYRSTRFAGRTSFYTNLDARLKLFNFSTYAAVGEFGVLGFVDNGRVWTDGESSRVWHQGYGGGMWASFFDAFLFSGTVGYSEEDLSINVGFGFLF